MKKYFLTIIAVIFSLITMSQIKHNKFTTGIKYAQFNPTFQFGASLIGEIQDQSGYLISSQYNDQIGGIHPTLIKLDIDGNILFDTIYEFIPNNSLGGLELIQSTTSMNSHTVLYESASLGPVGESPVAPYVINMDVNGNINWQVGLLDDTLELFPYSIINTQDGGYAVIGGMRDPSLGVHKPAGSIVKLDALGNILWDSLYRSTDTSSFEFNWGIETPDGGLLVAGISPQYYNNSDTPLLLAKLSSTGSVIWSKVMKLATPILPNYGPDEITMGMLNDTNAYVIYEVQNSSLEKTPAITSFNVNNGINNFTKIYSFPSEAELVRSTADKYGNILIGAMDTTNRSVIYKFDQNGNYIGAKSFMRAVPAPFNYFPLGIIATLDGGFIHTNYLDQDDIMVIKTDKDLDPSCLAIDSLYPYTLTPSVNVDTSTFNILDSIYSMPYLHPVALSQGSPFNTVADDSLICSCSNTITGTVTESGVTPVNNAKVYLFKKGIIPKPWNPIDSTVTDAGGNYQFNYVPTDSFLVRVEADTSLFPGALTSYFKEPVWCYRWDLAGVFHVHCDSSTVVKDVKLVVPPPLTGGSTVQGYVFESSGSFQKNQQPGDPIPGIDITVDQSPGGIAGGSTSGPTGAYTLTGINSNSTYIITIDFPGLPHDSVWTVNINLQDSIVDSLNFYIDSTGIYILEDSFGVGVDVIQTDNIDVDLYPNPTNGDFTVNIVAIKPENVEIALVSQTGKVISTIKQYVTEGTNKILLNQANDLPAGIYFLKIREGSNFHVKKIVKL